jgi:hypothetical protein
LNRSSTLESRRRTGAVARLAFLFSVFLLVVASSLLIFLSPLALRYLDSDPAVDWSRLGNIGQTYGAASALLAVAALIGVVASLMIQSREAKAAREQALRVLHIDLLKMALDDDIYLRCWGPYSSKSDDTSRRQHIYANLIVSHWQMMYEVGSLPDDQLRAMANNFFLGPVGPTYWRDVREVRLRTTHGRRSLRFMRVLDQQYMETVAGVADRAVPYRDHATRQTTGLGETTGSDGESLR